MTTLVKICGITNFSDARAAVRAGADFLGFVFYEKSLRFIPPVAARLLIEQLPARVKKVGVFVNETPERVKAIAEECGLDILQFHGDEGPGYLKGFKGYRVMKAVRVKDAAALKKAATFKPDYFLFDSFRKGVFGGTGEAFDWRLLEGLKKIRTPFFISGGLTPENVGMLLARVKPFAVDVSSGVELRPGKKSKRLMEKFVSIVRNTPH